MADETITSDIDAVLQQARQRDPTLFVSNEWDTPGTRQERLQRMAQATSRAGLTPDQAQSYAQRHYGDLAGDFGQLHQEAHNERQSTEARQRYANAEETFGHFWRSAISPVANFIETRQYGQAQQRIRSGSGTRQDFDTVAEHERLQEIARNRSLGGQLAHAGVGLIGQAMEFVAGGALLRGTRLLPSLFGRGAAARGVPGAANFVPETANYLPAATGRMAQAARGLLTSTVAPSMYLNQAAEANVSQGRDALDPRGFPAAVGMAMMNGAVLGSLGAIADNVPGRSVGAYLNRFARRVPLGMAEQAGVDAIGSFAGMSTGYGLGGDVYRWMSGEEGAGKKLFAHAFIQATTFAAFAAMHEAGGRDRIRDGFLTASRELRRSGISTEEAGRRLLGLQRDLTARPGSEQTRGMAQSYVDAMPNRTKPERAMRDYAQSMADVYIEVQGPGQQAGPGRPTPEPPPWVQAQQGQAPQGQTVYPGGPGTQGVLNFGQQRMQGGPPGPPGPIQSQLVASRPPGELATTPGDASGLPGQSTIVTPKVTGRGELTVNSPQYRAIKEAKAELAVALESGHMQSIVKAQDRLNALTSGVNTPEMQQLMRERSPQEMAGRDLTPKKPEASQLPMPLSKKGIENTQEGLRIVQQYSPGQIPEAMQKIWQIAGGVAKNFRKIVSGIIPEDAIRKFIKDNSGSATYRGGLIEKGINKLLGRKPEVEAREPARLQESFAREVPKAFEGAQVIQANPNVQRIVTGTHQIMTRLNPEARTLSIDFGLKPEAQAGHGPFKPKSQGLVGGMGFLTGKIGKIVNWATENGVGIRFQAETPKQENAYRYLLGERGLEEGRDGTWRMPPEHQEGHANARTELSDLRAHHGPEKINVVSGLVDHAVESVASHPNENVRIVLEREVPGIKNTLGRDFNEFARQVEEVAHETSGTERLARFTSPVRRQTQRPLQEEAQSPQNVAPNEGRPGLQAPEAGPGPAQSPGPRQADGQTPAPAPAGGSAAGGDVIGPSGHLSNPRLIEAMRNNPEMTIEQAQRSMEGIREAPGQEAAKPSLSDLVFSERGSFSHGEAWENLKSGLSKMWETVKGAGAEYRKIAGEMFPKTVDKNERVGAALRKLANAENTANLLAGGDKAKETQLLGQFNKENKKNLFDIAQREGIGFWGGLNEKTGRYKDMHEIKDGHRSFYVHDADVAKDMNEAIHHKPVEIPGLKPIATAANVATLAGPTEAIYHSKNLLTFLTNPKVAFHLIRDLASSIHSPEARARLTELSNMGVSIGKAKEGSTWNPMTHMGNALHHLRERMILAGDQAFTKLAANPLFEIKDTAINRANFLNQLGQYESKGQQKVVQLLRETGIGPFATAGTNFWVQGQRALTANPGIATHTVAGQAYLRAMKFGNMAAAAGLVGGLNYLIWGRVDGDKTTPFGAIKVGVDKSGKTQYFDLMNFTGLTRGARQTGLLALAEGMRQGQRPGQILDAAHSQAIAAATHPAIGPAAQFAHTLATGEGGMGQRLTPRVTDSRAVANTQAALMNVNPLIGSMTGANRSPEAQPLSMGERAMSVAGPFGVRTREPISQFRQEYHDLQQMRQLAHQTTPGRFENEARYQRLNRIQNEIARIDKQLKTASEERRSGLRRRQNELALLALAP